MFLALAALATGCPPAAPTPPRYESVALDEGSITARVTASGTLSPVVNVQVGSQVSGRIQELMVDFNSTVKKGQVLARLDPHMFDAAMDQAKANVMVAQGNLARAQAEALDATHKLTRVEAQHARSVVTDSDLETAQTLTVTTAALVRVAEGNLAQATAALHQTEINHAYTVIRSPVDGLVVSRNVDVGQTVAATLQSPVLFVIAGDLRNLQVDANVSEADVGRLTPGMKATFTVDAYPGRVFEGTVRQIRNAPVMVQNVVTYSTVIDVANPEMLLKPGMTATVALIHAQRDKAVRIPNAALRFRPTKELQEKAPVATPDRAKVEQTQQLANAGVAHAARRQVWLLKDGAPVPVGISVGISDGTVTELLAGDLHAGDRLVTEVVTTAPKNTGLGGLGGAPGGGGGRRGL